MAALYNKLSKFAEVFTNKRYWRISMALICAVYCTLSNGPRFNKLVHGVPRNIQLWNWINSQIDSPFEERHSDDPFAHQNKMAFRLVPPLVGKILPTSNMLYRMRWLFFVQNLLGVAFFYLLIKFAESNFLDKFMSILLPLCFSVIYAGKTFFWDNFFMFDGFAFFFLLLSVSTRNWLVVFFSLFLAFYTDERALVGSGFTFLFFLMVSEDDKRGQKPMIAVVTAILVYGLTRYMLMKFTGIHTVTSDISLKTTVTKTPFGYLTLATFTAFKAYWLLFIIVLFYLKGYKQYVVFIVCTLATIFGGLTIFDFARSISYGFIGMLAILYHLHRVYPDKRELNMLVLVLFFASMINPLFNVHWTELFISNPAISKFISG